MEQAIAKMVSFGMLFLITRRPAVRNQLARRTAKKLNAEIARIAAKARNEKDATKMAAKMINKINKRICTIATGCALSAAGIHDSRVKAAVHRKMQLTENYSGQAVEQLANSVALGLIKKNKGDPETFVKVFLEAVKKQDKAIDEQQG